MKLWMTIAILMVGLAVGFAVGAFVATVWGRFKSDHFIVRVFDGQECSDPEYLLELKGQTISVKGPGVDLYVMPPTGSPQQISYRIRARYSDCSEIVSDQRTVERGWLLYESIKKGSFHHQVRAR